MSRMMVLSGQLIEPGEVREVHLSITEAANSRPSLVPIIVIRGTNPGPTLCLTAAVHGEELNGTAILRELLSWAKPSQLRGTLIIVPIVNVIGYLARSRYLPDQKDLNRFFPGNPSGNMAERMAHRLFSEVIRLADYGLDFHTAISGRENFPHVRADMKNPDTRRMAKNFGTSVIIDDPGSKGMLRHAGTRKGIPSITFEGGTSNSFQRPIVKCGVLGLKTFLTRMGIFKPKKTNSSFPYQVVVRKTEWIRSERGGLLELKTSPGTLIHRGDPIAMVSNPLGREVHLLSSPVTGLVIGVTTSPVVNPGTPIAHVAKLKKTLSSVERALQEGRFYPRKITA